MVIYCLHLNSEGSRLKRAVNLNWRQFYPSEEIQQCLEMSLIVCTGRDNLHKKRSWKKDLHDPDKHDGMITHLEPDILECKVNWALGSITTNKASGGDGIPVELFQILKDDVVKVLHSIPANLENSAVATGLEKVSFHSNLQKRQCQTMFKLPHNCTRLTR